MPADECDSNSLVGARLCCVTSREIECDVAYASIPFTTSDLNDAVDVPAGKSLFLAVGPDDADRINLCDISQTKVSDVDRCYSDNYNLG